MSMEDIAQDVELQQWERNNLNRPHVPNYQPHEEGYGPAECADCGAEMHPVRRAMGARQCTPCKEITEQFRRR